MTIRHLAYRIAHDYPGTVIGLAAHMGKGAQVLTNKLNPNSETHHLTITELETLADFTNANIAIAEYFAHKANAVVVPLPLVPDESDMGLLDGYMAIMKEMGDLASRFQTAYADGDITTKEFEQIEAEVVDVQSKLLSFQAQIKRVVR